jgi:hypothetical protein
LFHDRVDFGFRGDIVTDGEFSGAQAAKRQPRVVCDTHSRPKRELQAGLQVEKSNRPILEFSADNAFCLQAKAVTVESDRPLQIVNPKSNECNPRLHGYTLHALRGNTQDGPPLSEDAHSQ